MNQKNIGIILIILGLVVASFVYFVKSREDFYIENIVDETGSCYLEDGTCLHKDRDFTLYIVGWAVALAMFLFGIYVGFIDKTQQVLVEHQVKVSKALEKAKKSNDE